LIFRISSLVPAKLGLPEFRSRLGHSPIAATRVVVPKATMHKDCYLVLRQHNVGVSGKIAAMKTKAKPHLVQSRSHDPFGLGALGLDPRHHA